MKIYSIYEKSYCVWALKSSLFAFSECTKYFILVSVNIYHNIWEKLVLTEDCPDLTVQYGFSASSYKDLFFKSYLF